MATQKTLKNTTLVKFGGSPLAANVITTNGAVFINPKVSSGDYQDMGSGTMGATKTYIDKEHVTAEFDIPVQMKKAPALGTAPSISELLKICGLSETIVTATSVTYAPGGANEGGGQIKGYTDGYVRNVFGIFGNMKISGKVGQPLNATFSLKGAMTSPESIQENNPAVTLDINTAPIVSKVTVLTVGGTQLNADSFDLDQGNVIKELYAMDLSRYDLNDFDPTITITAVKVKGTDEAAWTDYINGSVRAIIIQVGALGGQIEINIPYAKLKDVSESDDSGDVKISRTFRAEALNGNDNYTITYK